MLFACCVTLYNPDNNVIKRIENYIRLFDKIYLFDNTELENYSDISRIISKLEGVEYITENKNKGLSYALNAIMNKALEGDYDYLCTLDQDSNFQTEDIIQIKKHLESTYSDNYGIIGPHIIYHNEMYDKKDKLVDKRYIITSGGFINLRVIKKICIRFDENYFIDRVDVDFGRQIQIRGYRLGEYKGAVLYQQLGTSSGHDHPNHSPLRHYYIFRNRFYYNKKYYNYPIRFIVSLAQTAKHLILIILYESDKCEKITQLYYAYNDYRHDDMGNRMDRM